MNSAERKTGYLHVITKRGSTIRRVTVAQLLFGLAAQTSRGGGRREREGGEDVIRSADGGMSHFCGVISLNGEKHLSPRGEAGPQGTHACSIL